MGIREYKLRPIISFFTQLSFSQVTPFLVRLLDS